jgi:hypothetical protein
MPSSKNLYFNLSLILIIILAIVAGLLYTSRPVSPASDPLPESKFALETQLQPVIYEDKTVKLSQPQFLPYIKGEINFFQEGTKLYLTLSMADNSIVFTNLMGSITLPYGKSTFPLDKTMVYLEHDRSAIDIACHAWIDSQGKARNCEQLRRFLEGPLHSPFSLAQSLENGLNLISGKAVIKQDNKVIEAEIKKVTRLNPLQVSNTRHMSDKLNELSEFKADINLIICSRSLAGDPGFDPGLYLGGYPDNTGRWILSLSLN